MSAKHNYTHRLIRYLFPLLTMTRIESIETIRSLQAKLNDSKKDVKMWRERAISAERIVSYQVPNLLKVAVGDHDEKFGTCLQWRM